MTRKSISPTPGVAAILLLCRVALCGGDAVSAPPPDLKVMAVPVELAHALNLSSFYKKYVDAKGFPVLGSEKVKDAAMLEAARIVDNMLHGRDDVRAAIVKNKIRLAVMAVTEQTTDIPEHSDLTPKAYWNARARGLGATPQRPAVSCDEANVLHLPGDRYPNENILVHEFGHVIHEMGLNAVEPGFNDALEHVFQSSVKKKLLWRQTYAATNLKEYFAEGVQSYFDCNDNNNFQHNGIDTRAKLAAYDPEFFALLDKSFRQNPWRYERPGKPNPPRKEAPLCALRIENRSEKTVVIYRIENENDKEKEHTVIEPGESFEQSTSQGLHLRARVQGREAAEEFTTTGEKAVWVVK